jgi:hypothetical protein
LRKTFAPKREEVIQGCRNLHNEKHLDLYTSANIIREIKSRNVRGAGHEARMGEKTKFIQSIGGET